MPALLYDSRKLATPLVLIGSVTFTGFIMVHCPRNVGQNIGMWGKKREEKK